MAAKNNGVGKTEFSACVNMSAAATQANASAAPERADFNDGYGDTLGSLPLWGGAMRLPGELRSPKSGPARPAQPASLPH